MEISFNQNNQNYGSGTQINQQNFHNTTKEFDELKNLLEELKQKKSSIPEEVSKEVDELIEVVQNTTPEDMKSSSFISRFTQLYTTISMTLPKLVNSTKDIGSLINNIKTIVEGFWK